MDDKLSLRRSFRSRRLVLSSGCTGELRSFRIQERLLASELWKNCCRVAAYVSAKGEAGTQRILAEAWRSGRELFLPRCRAGEAGGMDLIVCGGPDELELSSFGIPEPRFRSSSRLLTQAELVMPDTLIIVPALAFDRAGYRLGYGGGYYDRLLARADCPSVGLTFHDLLFDFLPRDEWDRPVRAVCTEETFLWL